MKNFRKIAIIVLLGAFSLPAFAQNDALESLQESVTPEMLTESAAFCKMVMEQEEKLTNALLSGTQDQALEAFTKLTELYGTEIRVKEIITGVIGAFYASKTDKYNELFVYIMLGKIEGVKSQELQWRRDILATMIESGRFNFKN